MSEMVERVARAIAVAQWGQENAVGDAWRQLPDIMPAARAAILAMREPTGPMVDAADPHGIIVANFEDAWRAMVDEALKP